MTSSNDEDWKSWEESLMFRVDSSFVDPKVYTNFVGGFWKTNGTINIAIIGSECESEYLEWENKS